MTTNAGLIRESSSFAPNTGVTSAYPTRAVVASSRAKLQPEVVLVRTESVVTTRAALPTRRYSMTDALALLNRKAREAFDAERSRVNDDLKYRYLNRDITALAFYRALARMTQEEVATASGVPQPYVSKIERGRAKLSRDKAVQLAGALGVSASQLLELKDAK